MRQNEGADYWDRESLNANHQHKIYQNNIQVAKERFNQSQGVHTFQQMYGCQWDDETGATDAFREFGYDGEDFVSLDLKEMRYFTSVPQGLPTVQKWNKDRVAIAIEKNYFSTECIDSLKQYLKFGKSSLQRTAPPEVSVLQKSSSVSCHATGFYPSGVTITWKKNGDEHHEDVDLGQLLPNADGTFQKTSTLRVSSEELKNNKFSCEVEHQEETTSRSPAGKTNKDK
ncbi:hypothetical protein DNTS_014948 [Danionella cerebrum]|uniref:Ig-like domain-containing protein n=1 Tax=Danionella cerebrum TaxID=2873325 RepID=A0A553RP55_9TELE|nr:hypothetical protein DNTS_014948 [Danionella translucida]